MAYEGLGTPKAKISEVMSVVCAGEGVTFDDMRSASRKKSLAHPRQLAMALCREMTGQSYPGIARYFGDRDHTTLIYAVRKVASLEMCSPPMARKLDEYRQQIAKIVTDRLAALGGCSTQWTPPPVGRTSMLRPTSVVVTMGMAA